MTMPVQPKPWTARVQVPAYTDTWMQGDRYGDLTKIVKSRVNPDTEIAVVKLDKSGKTKRFVLSDCEVF